MQEQVPATSGHTNVESNGVAQASSQIQTQISLVGKVIASELAHQTILLITESYQLRVQTAASALVSLSAVW